MINHYKNNSSDNETVKKNKYKIIKGLKILTFIISLVFVDFYLLPRSQTNDTIDYYIEKVGKRSGKGRNTVSYKFYTKKCKVFSTKNYLIEETDIDIEYTLLLGSVTKVKSKDADYTKYLVNGLNGIIFYLLIILLFSIGISLKILLSKKECSENTFYNIICLNSFLVLVCLYMLYLF